MQVKKLALISIMAIAIGFTGCSDWNGGKNPLAAKDELSTEALALTPFEDIQISANSGAKSVPLPLITLAGSIHQIPEDGCIYILPDQGEFPHELQFMDEVKDPIKENSAVEVTGRFKANIYSECVGGAVFQVYQFKYLALLDAAGDNEKTKDSIIEYPKDRKITIAGIYRFNDNGCEYLEILDDQGKDITKKVIMLTFRDKRTVEIKNGTEIKVTGNYNPLEFSYCKYGPNFDVIHFELGTPAL